MSKRKKTDVKKAIKKRLIKLFIILLVLGLVSGGSYYFSFLKSEELSKIQKNISSTKNSIRKKKEDYKKSEEDLKKYIKIEKNKLPTENAYKTARERIDLATPIIKKLKQVYSFNNLNIKISEVSANEKVNSEKFEAYSNKLTFVYDGVSDEYVFSFVNDLRHELPGYLMLEDVTFKRNSMVSEKDINRYLRGVGGGFVNGNLNLEWTVLGAKSNEDKPNNNRRRDR